LVIEPGQTTGLLRETSVKTEQRVELSKPHFYNLVQLSVQRFGAQKDRDKGDKETREIVQVTSLAESGRHLLC